MTIAIIIIAALILIIGLLAWIITGMGRVADDMMDKIANPDRHDYKDTEREVGSR